MLDVVQGVFSRMVLNSILLYFDCYQFCGCVVLVIRIWVFSLRCFRVLLICVLCVVLIFSVVICRGDCGFVIFSRCVVLLLGVVQVLSMCRGWFRFNFCSSKGVVCWVVVFCIDIQFLVKCGSDCMGIVWCRVILCLFIVDVFKLIVFKVFRYCVIVYFCVLICSIMGVWVLLVCRICFQCWGWFLCRCCIYQVGWFQCVMGLLLVVVIRVLCLCRKWCRQLLMNEVCVCVVGWCLVVFIVWFIRVKGLQGEVCGFQYSVSVLYSRVLVVGVGVWVVSC